MTRFNSNGVCNCLLITEGKCKQCTACDVCKYYTSPKEVHTYSFSYPNFYYWGGQFHSKESFSYKVVNFGLYLVRMEVQRK